MAAQHRMAHTGNGSNTHKANMRLAFLPGNQVDKPRFLC